MPAHQREGEKVTLRETYDRLVPAIKKLVPEDNLQYLENTNEMHCNPDVPGGSKFSGVDNIFQVLERMSAEETERRITAREDDRRELIDAGAFKTAFLPAAKGPNDPPDLPEALYFKVNDVNGEIRIDQLKNLSTDTKVVVRREKGSSNTKSRDYAPASFTVAIGGREFPKTDFATVIVGRNPGSQKDVVWTIHPGSPIRAAQKDYPWSADLEVGGGVVVTTVGKLLEEGLTPESYIKITQGSHVELVGGDQVIREV